MWGVSLYVWPGVGLGSRKDVPSHHVPVPTLPCRLAGAGGRKKIFRLSDVLKPLTDAQVEAMKLGAVKRILRAEKAVACSGAAQVCLCTPQPVLAVPLPKSLPHIPAERQAPGSTPLAPDSTSAVHWPLLQTLLCCPIKRRDGSSTQVTRRKKCVDTHALALSTGRLRGRALRVRAAMMLFLPCG